MPVRLVPLLSRADYDLMEKVLLEAEMLDLKANPNRNATGSIIESSLDKGSSLILSGLAVGLSTLLIANTIGTPAAIA